MCNCCAPNASPTSCTVGMYESPDASGGDHDSSRIASSSLCNCSAPDASPPSCTVGMYELPAASGGNRDSSRIARSSLCNCCAPDASPISCIMGTYELGEGLCEYTGRGEFWNPRSADSSEEAAPVGCGRCCGTTCSPTMATPSGEQSPPPPPLIDIVFLGGATGSVGAGGRCSPGKCLMLEPMHFKRLGIWLTTLELEPLNPAFKVAWS
mmetsp:Transcript_44673/g.71873  ORF Transcript_44673/g.71873 Transcript_44673/m.71873 type:complete len:210 (+) Transcript_44673:559-1188(+)